MLLARRAMWVGVSLLCLCGYCAMSVAFGERDEGLPDVWQILDGKLFVFGKPNGVQDFAADQQGFIASGRANWANAKSN